MLLQKNSIRFVREFIDLVIIVLAFLASFVICQKEARPFSSSEFYLLLALLFSWAVSARFINLYDEFRSRNFSYETIYLIRAVLLHVISLIVLIFISNYSIPRSFVAFYFVILLIMIIFAKLVTRKILNYYRAKGRNQRNLLIIGGGKTGFKFYNAIQNNPHFGYKIIGILDDKKPETLNGEYIGPISELNRLLSKVQIDNIIVALPNYAYKKVEEIIKICERYTTRVKIIPDYFRFSSNKLDVSMFGPFPVFSINVDRVNEFHWRLIKRAFDIFFSLSVIIFLLSWLTPTILLLQLFLDKGPMLYVAKRWGRDSRPFNCLKFRSMQKSSSNSDGNGRHISTKTDDARITRLGKFLRKSNIDELPQFINVFLGHMSVVGPRPHDECENLEIKDKIDLYMWRHLVKPGITGWAQVNGFRGGTKKIELMKKRTEYDLWYIENWSFWLDLQIILLTVWHMIKGDPNAY